VKTLAILFVVVLVLNAAPAFAPPTWMTMSWIGFNVRDGNPFVLAVIAASAATIGRLLLAASARKLVRGKLMHEDDRQNIDTAAAWLEKHRTVTIGSFFLYALSPLPSNYLFIAYGLTGMSLRALGLAFFIGRTASYSLWTHLGRFAYDRLDADTQLAGGYFSGYFIAVQLVALGIVYVLAKLDWKMLLVHRTLAFRRSKMRTSVIDRTRVSSDDHK
jgi:uncharacterized membrane protein YdjX (TVP38/TMEM64 family)